MNRRLLKVVVQVRTGGCQRGAPTRGSCLGALSTEPARREVMLHADVVIKFDHTVVAVSKRRIGGEVVAWLCRQGVDVARPEIRHQGLRDRALRHVVLGKYARASV